MARHLEPIGTEARLAECITTNGYRYMQLFLTNQNKAERIARLIVSLFLLPSFFLLDQTWYSMLVGSVGIILLFNAIVGTCFIYRLFGASTCSV